MKTLRARLLLSHTLPLFLIVPLVGFALVYLIETRVLLVNLSSQLVRQGALLVEVARDDPTLWRDPARAGAFVARYDPALSARIMLVDRDGRVLAASDPDEAAQVGQLLQVPMLERLGRGEPSEQTRYSRDLQSDVADVWVPALDPAGSLVGAVRLTHELSTVYERFRRLRLFVLTILAGALGVGAVTAIGLAVTIERPISALTRSLGRLPHEPTPLRVEGPTELRQLAQSYNALLERQQGLHASRRHLLANLVHELGRPLGALRAALYALQHGATEDPALEFELLDGMDAEMARLERLLADLANLYDQVLGTLELDRQPTPLGHWLDRTLVPWREAARQKQVEWRVERPDSLPLPVVDGDRLAQALGNLLSNAIKYTPAGGSIRVAVSAPDGALRIEVADSGPGISESEQAHVFDPFFRSHAVRRFPQGMGLGLTIARAIVEAHGGRLLLASTVGQGSRFAIHLPLAHPRHDSP